MYKIAARTHAHAKRKAEETRRQLLKKMEMVHTRANHGAGQHPQSRAEQRRQTTHGQKDERLPQERREGSAEGEAQSKEGGNTDTHQVQKNVVNSTTGCCGKLINSETRGGMAMAMAMRRRGGGAGSQRAANVKKH